MRIAFLADALDLQYAGVHMYLRGLLNALSKTDKENEYLIVRPKPAGTFDGMEELVVPINPKIPGHQRLRAFGEIPSRLSNTGIEAVVETAHFGPFRLPGHVKRLTYLYDLTPLLFPHHHPTASVFVQRLLLPRLVRKADRVLTISKNTQIDIEQMYPKARGKVRLVFPAQDSRFRPVHDEAVLKKLGICKPYLLYVGTIEPRKNLQTLLQAYETFRQTSGQPHQLVLVGKKGWKNEEFFKALDQSKFRKDILLPGYVERDDLPVLFSMTKLFVFPSTYEGFGMPPLEAMACGAPVLMSNSSSLPEVGGDATEYFAPKNTEELAQKLTELTSNPQKLSGMKSASLQQAKKFSWEASAHQFMAVIRELKRAK